MIWMFVRRQLLMKEDVDEYILEFMDENKIKSYRDAIGLICAEHEKLKGTEWSISYVTKEVIQALSVTLNSELNKIKLGVNSADKNTQILLEIMNGIMYAQEIPDIITTDDIETDGFKTASQIVTKRITDMRQNKLNKQ